jgi:hypothetical protein
MDILKPFQNFLSPGGLQVPTGRLAIDWNNPFALNLEFCIVLNKRKGPELVRNLVCVPAINQSAGKEDINVYGPAIRRDLTNNSWPAWGVNGSVSDTPYTGPISILAGGTPSASSLQVWNKGTTRVHGPLSLWGTNAGGGNGGVVLSRGRSDASAEKRSATSTAAGVFTFDLPHIWGATDDGTSTVATFYVDGKSIAGSLSISGSPPWSGDNHRICTILDENFATEFIGPLNFVYVWSRILSAEDMTYLSRNPFTFIISDEGDLPVIFTELPATLFAQACM